MFLNHRVVRVLEAVNSVEQIVEQPDAPHPLGMVSSLNSSSTQMETPKDGLILLVVLKSEHSLLSLGFLSTLLNFEPWNLILSIY